MKPAAPSPWPLLLSRLQLAHSAVVARGELEAAGLDAEGLLRARIIERMDAARWCPPDCEQICIPNLDLESRSGDGLVGVACPNDPACWPGWQWVPRSALETYRCPAERIFAALRDVNGLAPLDVVLDPSIVPVGVLKRRGRKIPIVWMLEPEASFETLCSGLRHRLSGDGLIVLLSRPAGAILDVCRPGNIVILRVPEANDGDLRLWRALDAIDPSYRGTRIKDRRAIFDEVTMEFATIPGERHVVRINGQDCGGFRVSDTKFAWLLLLAGSRAAEADIDGGGWISKSQFLGDERDHDLEDVRKELAGHPVHGLSAAEMKALIKSAPESDGRIRLALVPHHIKFDSSLGSLSLVAGEGSQRARRGVRTPGGETRAANYRKARKTVELLLKKACKLGVPVRVETSG